MIRIYSSAAVMAVAALFAGQVQAGYQITDLGTLGTGSRGYAINASGQVAGEYWLTYQHEIRPFRHDGSTMTDLGTLGGSYSQAFGINDSGQVTGTSFLAGDKDRHAFRTETDGTLTDLGTLGGRESFGEAINNSGQVAGYSNFNPDAGDRDRTTRAFRAESDGTLTDLGTLGGVSSRAYGINDLGQVVGDSNPNLGSGRHAFRTELDGSMTDLDTLGGHNSSARAINNLGQVTGSSLTIDNGQHAFRTEADGTMTDLGTLGGELEISIGLDINNSGHVVGISIFDSSLAFHAFLHDGTSLIDLNSLIDPASGWVLYDANGINDAGQITGYGDYNGQVRAYLLTPDALTAVPEPGSLALLALGGIGLTAGLVRSRRSQAAAG